MASLESAAFGVWVGTGSRNEIARPDGHLPHAGAYGVQGHRQPQRRARSPRRSRRWAAILNAYTSREQTAFHARVLKDDVPLALDIIADILIQPHL